SPAGDSPEDWTPGDLAECLHPGPRYRDGMVPSLNGPKPGEVRAVAMVTSGPDFFGDAAPITFLEFARWPDRRYPARCFRKITPRADEAEAAEPEFAALIRKVPAPAEVLARPVLGALCASAAALIVIPAAAGLLLERFPWLGQ